MITIELNELKEKLKPIIGIVDSIEPIGNHDLERHLVYKVSCNNKNYVIKLYYKRNRWNREVASLKCFGNSGALIPQIVDYGVFDNGIEWLIYSFIEGELLSQVEENLSLDNLKDIYYDIGRQLGIIHHHKKVKFWGGMDKGGKGVKGFKTYREYFEDFTDEILLMLYSSEHQKVELFKEADLRVKSMYHILDDVNKPTLCHNDFEPRNILVSKVDDKYFLKAIIDFEQCIAIDRDEELVYFYLPLMENHKLLAENFKLGYEEFGVINLEVLNSKKDLYNLRKGLGICSWAKEVAYDYYLEGIKILEETMNR